MTKVIDVILVPIFFIACLLGFCLELVFGSKAGRWYARQLYKLAPARWLVR